MNFLISFTWNHTTLSEYFKALANELVKEGHRVVIITDRQRYDLISYENPSVLTWPSFRPTNLTDFYYAYKIIGEYGIDAIIANFSSVNILTIAGYIRGVPIRAAYYHTLSDAIPLNNQFKQKLLRYRKRIIYHMATHIISVSQAGKQDLVKTFKVNKNKILVRPYSIKDVTKNYPQDRTFKKEYDIISVATLLPHKGIDILIKAIYILSKKIKSMKVVIVGGGAHENTYKTLVKELGLASFFTFTGTIRGDKVIEYMLKSKLLVLPSRRDNYPAVLLEALGCGLPVVATNVGGIPEIIHDNESGFLVPPDNPEKLAERILTLLTDEKTYKKLSLNARLSFEKKHNLHTQVKVDSEFWISIAQEYSQKGNKIL